MNIIKLKTKISTKRRQVVASGNLTKLKTTGLQMVKLNNDICKMMLVALQLGRISMACKAKGGTLEK